MKNFQQTPRQRRDQKNQIAKHKHMVKTSNPRHSFELVVKVKTVPSFWAFQVFDYSYENIRIKQNKRL